MHYQPPQRKPSHLHEADVDPASQYSDDLEEMLAQITANNLDNLSQTTGNVDPITGRDSDGDVVDPNGNKSDFAKDWKPYIPGNLLMTNGSDYQLWDSESGTYKTTRAPGTHVGHRKLKMTIFPMENVQVGDKYKQYYPDLLMMADYTVGIFGESREWQYIGEGNWVQLSEFPHRIAQDYATWIFPMGGGLKGGGALLKWLGKFYAGRKVLNITKHWAKLYSKAANMKQLKAAGIPKSPSIFKNTNAWGQHIGWGQGHAAARAKIGNITANELKGMTKEMAGQWYHYYKNIARITPSNPSAAGRADLMKYIYENFSKLI